MQSDSHDDTMSDERAFRSDKPTLRRQVQLGCYYCEQLMSYEDIEVFVNGEQTALCPFCGIDAVVGLDTIPPDERTIKLMTWHNRFFG